MPIRKEHKEFHAVDLDGDGWHSPPGYPPGIEQKILAGSLDEVNKTGSRTRLLRFAPGAYTDGAIRARLLGRGLSDLGGPHRRRREPGRNAHRSFAPNTYACRPPGIYHGPFKSEKGCLLLELHYYEA